MNLPKGALILEVKASLFSYTKHSPPPARVRRSRDIGKDKDKCDVGEDEDGKEQSTPRGRKTANSQGRRKGRITTRSMANEAAAEEPSPPSSSSAAIAEPGPPEPPQASKAEPAQKSGKEPPKPQTPLAAMEANKGKSWRYANKASSPVKKKRMA